MISKEDINIICYYRESPTPIDPNSKIYYIDMNTEMDEGYLNEIKKKNRDLAIDAVLDDKIEEYNKREKASWPEHSMNSIMTISPMVHSIGLSNSTKFQSYDQIWNMMMDHFEDNTKKPHHFLSSNNISQLTYQKDSTISEEENSQKFSRKIVSRIQASSSMIAMSLSRRGPGTFIVVGTDIPPFFLDSFITKPKSQSIEYNVGSFNPNIIGNFSGMTVIVSNRIKSNKIIIGRSETVADGGGLSIMNDLNNYYLVETPHTFYKKFAWFEIN